jgi:hypothetical protein
VLVAPEWFSDATFARVTRRRPWSYALEKLHVRVPSRTRDYASAVFPIRLAALGFWPTGILRIIHGIIAVYTR